TVLRILRLRCPFFLTAPQYPKGEKSHKGRKQAQQRDHTMAPSTPQGGSAMSSRLLSMKFMQRAAATSAAPSPASASDGGSAKRRKLNSGSAGGSPAAGATPADDPFSQVHVKAALEELEAKRRAAVEKRAAELSDSHWVLDVPAVPAKGAKGSAGKPPLNIVYVGYGDIDRAEGNDKGSDGEEGDPEYEETQDKVQAGRRITGNYKKKDGKEKNQVCSPAALFPPPSSDLGGFRDVLSSQPS